MKKTLNKFLKFLGFNVVKAKRPRVRKLMTGQIDALVASVDCCRDNVAVGYQAGTFPAQKDNICVGTHNTGFGKESFAEITPTSPNNDNNVTGPTS